MTDRAMNEPLTMTVEHAGWEWSLPPSGALGALGVLQASIEKGGWRPSTDSGVLHPKDAEDAEDAKDANGSRAHAHTNSDEDDDALIARLEVIRERNADLNGARPMSRRRRVRCPACLADGALLIASGVGGRLLIGREGCDRPSILTAPRRCAAGLRALCGSL